MRTRSKLVYVIALLVSPTVSTQQVFDATAINASSPLAPAAITLNKSWQVLGPFPGGMRELPFGSFPPSVATTYAALLHPLSASRRHYSVYGPTNATTTLKTFEASVQVSESDRIKQSLTVEYPNVDWPWIRKSAGWSSLQWQMIAATNLDVADNNTALAITMDKAAEFAVVSKSSSFANASLHDELDDEVAIEWHTGDWYSYIAAFSKEDASSSQLATSQHLLHVDQGSYTLFFRSQYEIRIFGDPRNNGGEESPKITIGIDVAARSLQGVEKAALVEVHTDPHHSNVPHVVGGWIAGWGLSFAVRNVDLNDTYLLHSIDVAKSVSQVHQSSVMVELGAQLTVAPGQTISVPVKLRQTSPLDSTQTNLDLILHLSTASNPTNASIEKTVQIPLIRKPAFWNASSSDDDHNAYMYSYLAGDGTVQMAAATPPKRAGGASAGNGSLPPLILTLHGAGVDVRDLYFSNSIRRQEENWVILPTGHTPWGYDWQLASLEAADWAVAAFHKHLYGLPATMSEEERQAWQFDPEKLFVMGHSNGGQGAWYRLSRFPDRAIGGMVGSAYTKVSDYVSFGWKVGRHSTDPALQGVLHTGVTMFENDLFASNLAGLDLLVKFGSADANVPPWNSQDMAMIVDGWNQRSGLVGKVRIAEVDGRPHWWDTFFAEDDVQSAIDAMCSSSKNPGYHLPEAPGNFTLTVFNPAEAGSKGGWRIREVGVPGRLAKLEVRYVPQSDQEGGISQGHFKLQARNVGRFELDLDVLRRSNIGAAAVAGNATSLRFSLNGRVEQIETDKTDRVHFVGSDSGEWQVLTDDSSATFAKPARRIGPVLRIVTSRGPIVLVTPSKGSSSELKAWQGVARRFAADLLLYGAINSQIVTDAELGHALQSAVLKHSNIITLGGPHINTFTRNVFDNWPTKSSIRFPSPETSAQFDIQGRIFFDNGTALLTLAPHPTVGEALTLVVHGIGTDGISRAARLLPTRTATMIPEWIVTDNTAEWMGEGGVQAAGWYATDWGWSESVSYVQ